MLPDGERAVLPPVDPKLYGLATPVPADDVGDRPNELSSDEVGLDEEPLLEPLKPLGS